MSGATIIPLPVRHQVPPPSKTMPGQPSFAAALAGMLEDCRGYMFAAAGTPAEDDFADLARRCAALLKRLPEVPHE